MWDFKNEEIEKNFKRNEGILEGKLTKKELEEIFNIINKEIGREKFLNEFEMMLAEQNDSDLKDISDPYTLLKTLEKTYERIKNEEAKNDNERIIINKNKEIFDLMIQGK